MFDFVVSVFSQHLNPTFGYKLHFFSRYFAGSKCFSEVSFSGVTTVNIGMVKVVILFSKQTWIMFPFPLVRFYPKLPIHSAQL
jgi:hypothetical protein